MALDRRIDPYRADSGFSTRDDLKRELRRRLMRLSTNELEIRLAEQLRNKRPQEYQGDDRDWNAIQRVLDTTVGTTGNVLPRVDLEQTVYTLLLKKFPYLDRIRKGPANGLVHTLTFRVAA